MSEKNNTIGHNLLVDFNSSLSTILEDAERHAHQHKEKSSDIEKFKYTGDNSYVTSVLNKAHTQFPDEPDLAAVIALMGKEEQEDEIRNAKTAQWIQQTQQKIDQQQQSLGQHSADLQDKEARFRAQDQRFQDFNAKVAAMNLNPVQQAQAAQEFQKNPEQDPDQLLSRIQDQPQSQPPKSTPVNQAPEIGAMKVDPATRRYDYWDGKQWTPVRQYKNKTFNNVDKTDKPNTTYKKVEPKLHMPSLHKVAQRATQGSGMYADLISKLKNPNPELTTLISKVKNPNYKSQVEKPPEPELTTEGLGGSALEEIAKINLVHLYQGLVSGAKKVPLEFPNTQVPVALQDWQVKGFWDYLKSMGNAPGKEATITNLLSNPTYLLQWMAENIPSPNQVKKVTRRIPKGQTPDMFTTPTPKPAVNTPTVNTTQSELFEAKNTIEDDLLLEYLVSLNTVLDNASK
jgi:hypothetical protein